VGVSGDGDVHVGAICLVAIWQDATDGEVIWFI